MKDFSSLLVSQYKKNNNFFKAQLRLMKLDDMAVYIRFNNDHGLLLSTCQMLLVSSEEQSWSEITAHKDVQPTESKNYYLGDDAVSFYEVFSNVIKNNQYLKPVFCLPRKCTECEMIFIGFSHKIEQDLQSFYKQTVNNFELFCIRYLETFKSLIITIEPTYEYSFIFKNPAYLKEVIKTTEQAKSLLTPSERACLSIALTGKSYKEIARELKISDQTVKDYYRKIRTKLSCDSVMEAVIVALYLGEIGCLLQSL
jgi:DNA-binding CsgD family transcriptional regulator